MDNARCSNCAWFDPIIGKTPYAERPTAAVVRGRCRKQPPNASFAEAGGPGIYELGVWPFVTPDDWCGGFEDNAGTKPLGVAEADVEVLDGDTLLIHLRPEQS